jgi:hypothetical protein
MPRMFASRRNARLGSVQAHLVEVQDVRCDVLLLKGGETRAVLEVSGLDLALKSADEQGAVLDGFAALLNGLDGPVQIVARAVPQDVQAYLEALQDPSDAPQPEELVRLRMDHVAFVQALAARRTLIHHRSYIVIEGPRVSTAASPTGTRLLNVLALKKEHEQAGFEAACRQLTARADEVRDRLQAIGLPTHRLANDELLELLHEVLAPQQSALQRGRRIGRHGPVVSSRWRRVEEGGDARAA